MGNTKSQQASNCSQHERLGQVSLIQNTDQDGYPQEEMMITRAVESEGVFNQWMKQYNQINDTIMHEVLLLPTKTVFESTGMCGSSGIVKLKYPHYPHVFKREVQNRRRIRRYFLETELWYLLYTMVRAGSKFEKYHQKIGDLHPNSILINDDGLIKIISTCSFPGEQTNFDKFTSNPHEHVFLAPEQLANSLGRGQYPKNIDPSVSQCYSMGLTMLEAGTLEDMDSVYITSAEERKIQAHKINHYLKAFGQKYSSYLYEIVRGLLAQNPIHRQKCSSIYKELYPHEERILDLQPFIHHRQNNTPNYQIRQGQVCYNKVNYVKAGQSKPAPNMFYSQSGGMVSPIESKYVPMSQYQSGQQGYHPSPAHLSLPPGRMEATSQQSQSRNSVPILNNYRP